MEDMFMDAKLKGLYDYTAELMEKYSKDDAPQVVSAEDFVELADVLKETIAYIRQLNWARP
jgi:hypothetical protein